MNNLYTAAQAVSPVSAQAVPPAAAQAVLPVSAQAVPPAAAQAVLPVSAQAVSQTVSPAVASADANPFVKLENNLQARPPPFRSVNIPPPNIYTNKKCTREVILDVVAVISNPARFKRRYQLFNEFCERMRHTPNVRLTTVELQQRARNFVTDANIKLRTKHELWHKENLINVAIQSLPRDWEYVAWIDADIEFHNDNWAQETLEQLQTYSVVQLFSHAIELGPNKETLQVHSGFIYLYINEVPMNNYNKHKNYKNGHTGYGWACRKSAYNHMGGLMDFPILGSADAHMALCFIGDGEKTINQNLNRNYKEMVRIFQDRCERHIKRNVGYVKGTISHHYHQCKKFRMYHGRWKILLNNDFDPLRDIKKDHNDLWQLEDTKPRLRDDIRKYFRQRNEDSDGVNQDYTYFKQSHFHP
jgi:hypothetical protein